MRTLFEVIFWIKIFLSPNFAVVLIIGLLYKIFGTFSYWYLTLFVPGIFFGVILAERARKKYGTSDYYAKPMNTPDIVETWEIEKRKEKEHEINNNDKTG